MVEAWDNEPFTITDPRHPTGIGTDVRGCLVVGWQGRGREVRIGLSELRDAKSVARAIGELQMAGGPGISQQKLDFLGGLLVRRVGRDKAQAT